MNRPLVLIAEDDDANGLIAEIICNLRGFAPIRVEDGAAALLALATHEISLIFMDVRMPVMNGFEAIKLAKNDPRFRHIPLIAVTALAQPADQKRILAAGADGILIKPYTRTRFEELLDRWSASIVMG
ncbi:MAG: response regulator [Cyanobacteria bacterium NC_groundwater_1444_Ag_S-0.65um_54_12]|nr:response regulator [Cyanobacteria bacterium NC_groundwater_1444_Ag_S-0.65um_54_12]